MLHGMVPLTGESSILRASQEDVRVVAILPSDVLP